MKLRAGVFPWWAVVVVFLLLAGTLPAEQANGKVIPLAVRDGRCECTFSTSPEREYLLILGSLSLESGEHFIGVRADPSSGPAHLPREATAPHKGWARETRLLRERLDRARRQRQIASEYPPAARPRGERSFYIFTGEGSLQDPRKYVRVTGALRATGRRCQVYVDMEHRDLAGIQPAIAEVVRVFDDEVYVKARQSFGRAVDVDRDGRFTILFTPWVGKLSAGAGSLDGFVRGSDFYRDLDAPFSNRCDMMYLNDSLRPGPYLRTLLAHEYTHAVIFSEHVLTEYLPEAGRQDEEAWLNEALAHLAEDAHGFSWDNLDYRISAFLSGPERYGLVCPDYHAAGLWRSHGHRGAAYLFLRWCADTYGLDLPARLVQSNLFGIRNVEVATGTPFAELFRRWSAALALSGTGVTVPAIPPIRRLNLREPLGRRFLCGPRFEELSLGGETCHTRIPGTGIAFVLLHSPAEAFSRLTIETDTAAQLQVSLIRLPRKLPRLVVHWEAGTMPSSGRLHLTARNAGLTLDHAAWERLIPTSGRAEDTSFHANVGSGRTVKEWFGDLKINTGETRTSSVIALPSLLGPETPLVFKISAHDARGRRIAGWTLINAKP